MTEIDFITGLGRLLRDGHLRDGFTADPQAIARQMNLRRNDWPSFLELVPADLEFQAHILLRKRFELVRPLLPETVRRLGDDSWTTFLEYARASWPAGPRAPLQDAFQFCQRLRLKHPRQVSKSEWNRLRFAFSEKHLAIHWMFQETIRGKSGPMMHLFSRGRSRQWSEFIFRFGL